MPTSVVAAVAAAASSIAAGGATISFATIAFNAAMAFAGSFVLGHVSHALPKKPGPT